jgi:uncharacterized protein (DUF2336 family)
MEPAAQDNKLSTIKNLLTMALDRTTHGRGALAKSILQVCLQTNSSLSTKELKISFDILRNLVRNVEMEVRRTISERLATRGDLPHDIALFLANDQIEVAYPVLVGGIVLEDVDLIMITRGKTASHQIAVTLRRHLSKNVSNALVETQNIDVIDSLLRNPTVQIGREAMVRMVEMSRTMTPVQKPLLQREDLPSDLAWRMYGWVDAVLKNFIVDTFPEARQGFGSEIDNVLERAMATSSEARSLETEPEQTPSIKTADLLRVLETESMRSFQSLFAQFSDLPQGATPTILNDAGGESLAIVCKACDVPIGNFLAIYVLLRAKLDDAVHPKSAEFSAIKTFYERLEFNSATSILSEWRTTDR